MICIWDNGGAYSDHTIYFYDCGPFDREFVEATLGAAPHGGYLVAFVESVEWRSVEELFPFARELVGHDDSAILALAPACRATVIAAIKALGEEEQARAARCLDARGGYVDGVVDQAARNAGRLLGRAAELLARAG